MDTYGKRINVLVVDDRPIFVEGVISLLDIEPSIFVVGNAKNGEECLALAGKLKPDVVLLESNLLNTCGFDLLEKLRGIQPQIKVVMLLDHYPEKYLNSSLAKGVEALLLKDCSAEEMTKAVLRVFAGEVYFSPELRTIFISLAAGGNQKREPCFSGIENLREILTSRETEIMELVAEGLQNKEIAGCLGVKTRTVEFHISNIFLKLGAGSRVEAILNGIK